MQLASVASAGPSREVLAGIASALPSWFGAPEWRIPGSRLARHRAECETVPQHAA
jgi:hypothetical protein